MLFGAINLKLWYLYPKWKLYLHKEKILSAGTFFDFSFGFTNSSLGYILSFPIFSDLIFWIASFFRIVSCKQHIVGFYYVILCFKILSVSGRL